MTDQRVPEQATKPHDWRPERTQAAVAAYLFASVVSMFGLQIGGLASLGGAIVLGVLIAACIYGAIRLADYFIRGTAETDAALARQRARNLAIGLALGGLVVLFYVATFVRMSANIIAHPIQ